MLVLKRFALAREISRCAQDDGEKASGVRVILERSEESRFLPCLARFLSLCHPDRSGGTPDPGFASYSLARSSVFVQRDCLMRRALRDSGFCVSIPRPLFSRERRPPALRPVGEGSADPREAAPRARVRVRIPRCPFLRVLFFRHPDRSGGTPAPDSSLPTRYSPPMVTSQNRTRSPSNRHGAPTREQPCHHRDARYSLNLF